MALGLGANLGTRSQIEARFRHALESLGGNLRVGNLRVASLYRTRALSRDGQPLDQPDFLNTVAVGELEVPATEDDAERVARRLLARCKRLEAAAGRNLHENDAGEDRPRPLDLDLLLLGHHVLDLPPRHDLPAELWPGAVRVPHPRLAGRRFVLRPLAELVSQRRIPGDGRTVARALADLETAGAQSVERLPGRRLEIRSVRDE